MDSFIDSLGLPIEFEKVDDGVYLSKFDSSDLYAKIYSLISNLEFTELNNELSKTSLMLDTFRWNTSNDKYMITLKADFEHDNYSCTVEEII